MDWTDWIFLPLIGAVGGFLAGLLGVGGGLIFVPVLTHYFQRMGMDSTEIVKYTLANSIFLVFVSGVSGMFRQHRLGGLDWKRAARIGIPGAIVAVTWSYLIEGGTWYHKSDFQIVFLGFLLISISNMLLGKTDHSGGEDGKGKNSNLFLDMIVALLAGTVVALSGLGGGVVMVPLFRMILKMPMKSATVMSLSIIPLLSLFPILNYLRAEVAHPVTALHTGYIVWPVALPISLGVAIFAGIGLKTAKHVPVLYLRIIFALLSATIFIKTIWELYHS